MKNSAKDFIFGDGNTMNHMFRQFSMGAIAMAVMQAASAQVSITNIVPMQIPGQGTEIRVMFNGLPPQPQAYQLEQPSRLVLDFDKAQQSLKQGSIAVATAEASTVDVTSDAQRSRLTVNLADAGAFTTRVEGNTFILKINSANPALATPVAAARSEQGISNIRFQSFFQRQPRGQTLGGVARQDGVAVTVFDGADGHGDKVADLDFDFTLVILEFVDGHVGLGLEAGVDDDEVVLDTHDFSSDDLARAHFGALEGFFKEGGKRFRH